MRAFTAVAAGVSAVVVLVGIVAVLVHRRTESKFAERRRQVEHHRGLASFAALEAERQAAEANEQAAQRRRSRLAAEQQQREAAQSQDGPPFREGRGPG